jgi:hypothetical protein
LFVGSFLFGWMLWPCAYGLADFLALAAMAGSTSYFIRAYTEANLGLFTD